MKKVIFILLILTLTAHILNAQVRGNANIISKTFSIEGVTEIIGAIYADIQISANGDDIMTIIADENLIPLIDTEVVGGKITLQQKEWIQSSERIKIKMSVKNLKAVSQEVHENMIIDKIDVDQLRVMSILGSIEMRGKVKTLNANAESGALLAQNLEVEHIRVNIWDDGKLVLNSAKSIIGAIKNDAIIKYSGEVDQIDVKTKGEAKIIDMNNQIAPVLPDYTDESGKFISIKLKNNSPEFISAYVRGPKPNGKFFSYGFNIAPGQIKKEKWTVGTKVFRVNKVGLKKRLVTLRSQDENQVVKLF